MEFVRTSELTSLLADFCIRWQESRPSTRKGTFGRSEANGWLTADQYLYEKGIDPHIIWEIRHRPREFTSFTRADRIVMAMGLPEAYHDGRLNVIERR